MAVEAYPLAVVLPIAVAIIPVALLLNPSAVEKSPEAVACPLPIAIDHCPSALTVLPIATDSAPKAYAFNNAMEPSPDAIELPTAKEELPLATLVGDCIPLPLFGLKLNGELDEILVSCEPSPLAVVKNPIAEAPIPELSVPSEVICAFILNEIVSAKNVSSFFIVKLLVIGHIFC